MVTKQERISRSEFTQFFACGTRHHSPCATLIVVSATARKLAVVVGKKVSKSAVRRNTLRRQVYHVLATTAITPAAYILILKPVAATIARKQLAAEIKALIGRAVKNQ